MKKFLLELPMLGLGVGLALTGASAAAIGVGAVKKSYFYGAAILMVGGTWTSYIGSQVAIGSVERIRGLR